MDRGCHEASTPGQAVSFAVLVRGDSVGVPGVQAEVSQRPTALVAQQQFISSDLEDAKATVSVWLPDAGDVWVAQGDLTAGASVVKAAEPLCDGSPPAIADAAGKRALAPRRHGVLRA